VVAYKLYVYKQSTHVYIVNKLINCTWSFICAVPINLCRRDSGR